MALGRVVVTLLVVDGVAVRLVDEVLLVVVTARVELPGLVVDGLVVRVVDDVVVRVGVVLVGLGLVEDPVLRAGAVAGFLVGVVTVVLVGLVAVVLVVPFVVRTGVRRVVPALVAEAVRVVAFVSPVYLDVDEPLLAALADEPEEVILVDDVLVLRLERLAIPKPDPPPE